MKRKRWVWATGAVLASYLAVCWLVGVWVAEGALHPARRALVTADIERVRRMANEKISDLADVTISATDGAVLRGWSLIEKWNGQLPTVETGQNGGLMLQLPRSAQ